MSQKGFIKLGRKRRQKKNLMRRGNDGENTARWAGLFGARIVSGGAGETSKPGKIVLSKHCGKKGNKDINS